MDRDFDQSDGRVLAEFAGLEIVDDSGEGADPVWVEVDDDDIWDKYRVSGTTWFGPWHWTAPRWQTQLLLDAVREKGLVDEFKREFEQANTELTETLDKWDYIETSPEAICMSILQLGGE